MNTARTRRQLLEHLAGMLLIVAILLGIILLTGVGAPEEAGVLLLAGAVAGVLAIAVTFKLHAAYVTHVLGISASIGITGYLAWETSWILGQVPTGTEIRPMNLAFHLFQGAVGCLFFGILTGVVCIVEAPKKVLGWTIGLLGILVSLAPLPVLISVFHIAVERHGLVLRD